MRDASSSAAVRKRERDLAFTVALFVVALLPRLFVAIAWTREPVWDGHYYQFGAERIAAGLGYSEDVLVSGTPAWRPWCHYPVGYSAFVAAGLVVLGPLSRALFGSTLLVAPLLNALVGSLTVVFVHRLARYYLSVDRARIAGTLAALHPGLIAYTVLVMTEPLTGLLLIAAGWAILHWNRRWPGTVLAGVILGLATLVRPSSLLAAPLLVVLLARPWWSALARAAVATALAVLVCVPWTLRNCRVMDACTFVSTNGGWNLAIGALTDTGRFVTLRAADGCPVVTGQVQQDRCWAQVGREKIAADPWRWIGLMPAKLSHTFSHESFAIEYLHEADPASWTEPRRRAGRLLLTTFHRLLLIAAALAIVGRVGWASNTWKKLLVQGALLGLVGALTIHGIRDPWHPFHWLAVVPPLLGLLPLPGSPWQGPVGRYALGLLLTTAATHAVFFGEDRYHIVVAPILCLLAAAALRPAEGDLVIERGSSTIASAPNP